MTAGSLTLGADTDNTITANSMTMSKNTPFSLTFAGAKVDGSTKAFLGADTEVTAGDVSVAAGAITDVQAGAAVFNTGASGVGVAVALSLIDTDTRHGSGVVNSSGDVAVTAATDTVNHIVETDSRDLGCPATCHAIEQPVQPVRPRHGGAYQRPRSWLYQGGTAGVNPVDSAINKLFPVINSGSVNLSGSVAYAQAENDVRAFIGSGEGERPGRRRSQRVDGRPHQYHLG